VFELTIDLFETSSSFRQFLLESPQLLNLDENLVVRCRASTHSSRSIVDVSIVGYTLHSNGGIVGASFRNVLVRYDENVAVDVFESSGNLLVVPN